MIRDKDGKAQYIIGVIEDVTERKRLKTKSRTWPGTTH